jgi:hypothetical protein
VEFHRIPSCDSNDESAGKHPRWPREPVVALGASVRDAGAASADDTEARKSTIERPVLEPAEGHRPPRPTGLATRFRSNDTGSLGVRGWPHVTIPRGYNGREGDVDAWLA